MQGLKNMLTGRPSPTHPPPPPTPCKKIHIEPANDKQLLIAWTLLKNSHPSSFEEIASQIIWSNQYICVNGKSVFNERLSSTGFHKVGDLLKLVCIDPRITELQLNMVDLLHLKGLYHSLSPERKKTITSNANEVLLKTVPFNGVEYLNAEVLSSKKI